jgi:hypothetical protein
MTIRGFSNIVYYITILKAPGGYSAYILPLLEYTRQYPYLYHLVAITRYLTSESGEISH